MLEQIKNIKTQHKILSVTFLLFFLAFIFFHIRYNLGLFFDQPAQAITSAKYTDGHLNGYFIFIDYYIRNFTNFLVSVVFNIIMVLYKLFVNKINFLTLTSLFTSSYFIVQIFGIILNFLVAQRTKRYDIAVIAFAFYCLFCLPSSLWAIRESSIAFLFYFTLLSYFLSKKKLSKVDILPITLLIIYMFESYETTIIYGILLNIFACLYIVKKQDENIVFKHYIGSGCLAASVYIITSIFKTLGNYIMSNGFEEWLDSLTQYVRLCIHSNVLISIFGIILIIFCLFYKKLFDKKSTIPLIIFFIFSGFVLWIITKFVSGYLNELNNAGGALMFIFPVILIIILLDYLKIEITMKNPAFISNLFTIACIIGIFHLTWQIHNCFQFDKYVSYLKNLIHTSNTHIIKIPQEDFDNHSLNLGFYTPFGIVHQSILLNETNLIDKIIVPNDDNEWLSDDKYEINEYYVKLQTTYFENKHKKYIDTSEIIKYIDEYKNLKK